MRIKILRLTFGLIVLLLLSGTVSMAYALTNSTGRINPQDATGWFNEGLSLYGLGNSEEAIAAYDKAIEIYPNFTRAWNNKGFILNNLGRKEEAIAAFDKALEIDPNLAETWDNKGVSLHDLGRNEEAIAAFNRTLEINPNFASAWSNKGNSLLDLGRNEEAIAAFDKALEIDPHFAQPWNNKGFILNNLGRKTEAIAAFDKAIEIDQQYTMAWYSKGVALSDLGRNEEAIAAFDKAIQTNPQYTEAWFYKGNALAILGRYEGAIASYNKTIEINPRHNGAWFNKGVALHNLGRNEEAIAAFDKAIEIDPHYTEAWYNKGMLFMNLGRNEEAIAAFDKAIEINPKNVDAWHNEGVALNKLGRYEEGVKRLFLFDCKDCGDFFSITEINIVVDEYRNSRIELNLVQLNKSDNIQLQTPLILPEYLPFRIQKFETTQKASEIIGARSEKGNTTLNIDLPIKQYKLTCINCIYILNEKPFESYLFIFPFVISKDYQPVQGNIHDAIFVEIPDNFEFGKVGKDKIVGGGLVKVQTSYNVLPNDLTIAEMPGDAFGFKINGERTGRVTFDPENHLVFFEYGRSFWYMFFAILIPMLVFIFYILIKLFWFKDKDVNSTFYIFLGIIVALRYYFIGLYKPVVWDFELLTLIIIAMYITLKRK